MSAGKVAQSSSWEDVWNDVGNVECYWVGSAIGEVIAAVVVCFGENT
jgi:hypothetical protein